MTKQELLKAFEMKIDGHTYKEIGKTLTYCPTHIYRSLSRICAGETTSKRHSQRDKYHYPKLKSAIFSNYSSINEFCIAKDLPYTTVVAILRRGHKPSERVRQLIASKTNISAEELFTTKEN